MMSEMVPRMWHYQVEWPARTVAHMMFGMGIGIVLLIKLAIGRPRPLSSLVDVVAPVSGNSFPSGHVMFYTVFFGFLFFLAWARLPASLGRAAALTICGGLVLLIGPSRMYLGAHWLSDVIAAHLLGLIILTFGIEFYLRYISAARPAAAPRASP